MRRFFSTAILFGVLSQTALSQDFNRARLDSFFNALDINNKFMGSVALSKNGNILYINAIGYADVADKVKANKYTRYHIGSISKTFTAVLVLKAVEQNKLTLDQTIDRFFPAIENAKAITIDQLLHHRSGIPNYTAQKDYLAWRTKPKTEKELVNIIAKSGSDFEPGSKFEYSNSNYALLTYILEKVFNQSYADLLQEYICKPLGLTDTYLGGRISTEKKEARSYIYGGSWELQPETDSSVSLGAGGIVSTPVDLVKFSNALFNGRLLTAENLKRMETLEDGYGMGLFQVPFYDIKGYGHNGKIDGFTSTFYHFSDGNVSYALTSNGTNFNENDIAIAVLSAAYNKPYAIPSFSTYRVSPEELAQYSGVYASPQIPLKITITRQHDILTAQATGQAPFPLEATSKNTFTYAQAGITLEFIPENKMLLLQHGNKILFTKEK